MGCLNNVRDFSSVLFLSKHHLTFQTTQETPKGYKRITLLSTGDSLEGLKIDSFYMTGLSLFLCRNLVFHEKKKNLRMYCLHNDLIILIRVK